MTLASIERCLAKIDAGHDLHGDAREMTDAQLMRAIRRGYAVLRAEHGNLVAAAIALRATGDDGGTALAILIEEDAKKHDAPVH